MDTAPRVVKLCGEPVTCRHVCMFTGSAAEQYRVLLPFILDGLAAGDEVLTIVDAAVREAHADRLEASGVQVGETLTSGQLRILASEDTYGRDGTFAAERMYALLEEVLEASSEGQWGWLRVIGEAGWVLRTMQGSDELMAYEAKVNLLAPRYPCTLVCVYDINQCSGQVVADALATHSHLILGGRLLQNPYYMDPLEFLQKVTLRRGQSSPLKAATTA